jgi:hypothetical protein
MRILLSLILYKHLTNTILSLETFLLQLVEAGPITTSWQIKPFSLNQKE